MTNFVGRREVTIGNLVTLGKITAVSPIACQADEKALYGDFDSIGWRSLTQIAELSISAIDAIGIIKVELVALRKFIISQGDLARAGIDLQFPAEALTEGIREQVASVVTDVLQRVVSEEMAYTQSLFTHHSNLSAEHAVMTAKVADEFLAKNGRKPITTPVNVEFENAEELYVSGRFASAPPAEVGDGEVVTMEAVIDGLMFSAQDVYFLTNGKPAKISLKYDDQEYFGILNAWLGMRNVRKITFRKRRIANGSWISTLLAVTPIE